MVILKLMKSQRIVGGVFSNPIRSTNGLKKAELRSWELYVCRV